jgi:hypothetical protein
MSKARNISYSNLRTDRGTYTEKGKLEWVVDGLNKDWHLLRNESAVFTRRGIGTNHRLAPISSTPFSSCKIQSRKPTGRVSEGAACAPDNTNWMKARQCHFQGARQKKDSCRKVIRSSRSPIQPRIRIFARSSKNKNERFRLNDDSKRYLVLALDLIPATTSIFHSFLLHRHINTLVSLKI